MEEIQLNGKESAHASFLKFTGHSFRLKLLKGSPDFLNRFKVNMVNKTHEFWQERSLAVELYSPKMVYQKLDYIHNNPCRKKWMLSHDPVSYPYSSFEYYESGVDKFGFLSHIGDRL
ncbi:transposase [Algoriphagus sp. NG3]|uniref:transposase n=1 Tax=Algoriphagus sp. NG3 TaxID=3097546 RepID=UPI002A80F3F5|nr:transposase [Algoriphagus sp. NG3]WPR76179.1 transposase [Algoriphagus sp. NG3]